MKRVLALLTLAAALFLAGSCTYHTDISVDATATMIYDSGRLLDLGPYTIGGFHRRSLSDSDVERVIYELFQSARRDYPNVDLPRTGILHLRIFDEISGEHLRDEEYALVYNSTTGYYDFAGMDSSSL